eukprot:3723102-Alexandrium_andersonii.AAC.1
MALGVGELDAGALPCFARSELPCAVSGGQHPDPALSFALLTRRCAIPKARAATCSNPRAPAGALRIKALLAGAALSELCPSR